MNVASGSGSASIPLSLRIAAASQRVSTLSVESDQSNTSHLSNICPLFVENGHEITVKSRERHSNAFPLLSLLHDVGVAPKAVP